MESWLVGRIAALGVDEDAFVPFVASLCEGDEQADDLRDRLKESLEGAGAEDAAQLSAFVDLVLAEVERRRTAVVVAEEAQLAAARVKAESALSQGRVLRSEQGSTEVERGETSEERKQRLALLARYDVPDELEMDASGKVIVRDAPTAASSGGLEDNDNVERVRLAEAAKREAVKAASAKQKELAKTAAFDGKKKKAEAKEKRREKAVKVERKRF